MLNRELPVRTTKCDQALNRRRCTHRTKRARGQVIIPETIRNRLGLKTGAQFVVVADRDVVILKVLEPPALSDFAELSAQARRAAKAAGVKPGDVAKARANVRRAR